MNLADQIIRLRKSRGMSQAGLAEALNVSRQSISKWETGASVPELDKLIQLSDLFGISLDDLVRNSAPVGTQTPPPAPESEPEPKPQTISRTQQIIGYVLLGTAFLLLVLTFVGLLPARSALLLGVILAVYGGVCMLARKYAGLIIGWLTMVPVLLLLPHYTGVRLLSIFTPDYYHHSITINIIMGWILWFALLLLILATIRAFRKK